MRCDCHIHMVLDGVYYREALARHAQTPDMTYIRAVLARYRDAGFTYLRDGGDRWGVGAAARAIAPEYGIVYRTPLAPLYRAGYYGAMLGTPYESLSEFARLVRKAKRDGADFIKIMISGLMDFDRFGVLTLPPLAQSEIGELIHVAHGEGMRVMAHANGTRTVEAAARAGVDSVEHGAYLDNDALCAMREANTVWVPTLSTVGNLRGKGRFDEHTVERILQSALENVAAFDRMGGLIAPGSDAGAWAVPHAGLSEYELLSCVAREHLDAGAQALRARF